MRVARGGAIRPAEVAGAVLKAGVREATGPRRTEGVATRGADTATARGVVRMGAGVGIRVLHMGGTATGFETTVGPGLAGGVGVLGVGVGFAGDGVSPLTGGSWFVQPGHSIQP